MMEAYRVIFLISQQLRKRLNHRGYCQNYYILNTIGVLILKIQINQHYYFLKKMNSLFQILSLSCLSIYFILMRKKNLRIHKAKHSTYTETDSFFQMSEQSPKIDTLKKYLAELREQPMNKDKQLGSSFSFDLSLTEWKSNARLTETVPLSSIYKNKNMCLLTDQQQPSVQQTIQAKLQANSQEKSSFSVKAAPKTIHSKEKDKPTRRKMLLNFSKGRFRNRAAENDTTLSRQKKWIKPSLYSLQQPRNIQNSKISIKKKIQLNFSSCKKEKTRNLFNFTKSHKIQFDRIQTLHGIHCFRNKFQLILNSRSIKRKDCKLFKCSTIRPLLNIQISTPKHL